MSYKAQEMNINALMTTFMLAAHEDLKANWNGPPVFGSEYEYQTYANICKPKGEQSILKPRFNLTTEVKQYLSFMFNKLAEEVSEITMEPKDTRVSLRAKLTALYDECFTEFMFAMTDAFEGRLKDGLTLLTAESKTKWVSATLTGRLSAQKTYEVPLAIIADMYTSWLKTIAWLLVRAHCYMQSSLNGPLFMTIMAHQGMCQPMLDQLWPACLREKKTTPRKPKTKPSSMPADGAAKDVTPDTLATLAGSTTAGATIVPPADPAVLSLLAGINLNLM